MNKLIGNTIQVQEKTFTITQLLGKGKSGYSYLIENKNEKYVYKQMHNEHVDYYNFSNKLMAEIGSYERMITSGISMPKLIEYSDEKQYLIKEYIHGDIASDLAAQNILENSHFKMIFQMNEKLKKHGIHIDYFPTNFIYSENSLYCIDYECHSYMAEWDFENWGVYYWLNSCGMAEHLKTGQPTALNKPGEPKPIAEPFEDKKTELLNLFNNGLL